MAGKLDAPERRHRQGLLATYTTAWMSVVVAIVIGITDPQPPPTLPPPTPPSICDLARDVVTDADPNPHLSEAVQRGLADQAASTLLDCFAKKSGKDEPSRVAPEPAENRR